MRNTSRIRLLWILFIAFSGLSLSCSSSKDMVVQGENLELRDQLRRKGKKGGKNTRQALRHSGRLKGQLKEVLHH